MFRRRFFEKQIALHRPSGKSGALDERLPRLAAELRAVLAEAQAAFAQPTCRLEDATLDELAVALVEFAEDIHAGIGLWKALEEYQREFFGTPLPLFLAPGEAIAGKFDPRRVRHFLYVLWRQLEPDILLAPDHQDLVEIAEKAGAFLTAAFRGLPKDSGAARFLGTPNDRGWDVKRKLVWAGEHSYLFRHQCVGYLHENGTSSRDIEVLDDFICQRCTEWCGLGVIDLVAGALTVPEHDRAALRTWYERHNAPYRVIELTKRGARVETMEVINVINDQPYSIRLEVERCPFATGQLVIGSLVPWRGEWYWSGAQRVLQDWDAARIATLRSDYIEKFSAASYRYRPDLAQKAREIVLEHCRHFVAHHGSDLIAFPDGASLAAAEQARVRAMFASQSGGAGAGAMKRRGLPDSCPKLEFPQHLLRHRDGIGAFFNPDEGVEYMLGFRHVLLALGKGSAELTDEGAAAVRELIESESISPAFVERLVREHGCGGILRAYLLRDGHEPPALAWLLRRFKGKYYRRRFPAISFTQGENAEGSEAR